MRALSDTRFSDILEERMVINKSYLLDFSGDSLIWNFLSSSTITHIQRHFLPDKILFIRYFSKSNCASMLHQI